MSIYDKRDSPAYDREIREYRNVEYDAWWSPRHDRLIEKLIKQFQWNWFFEISDNIKSITPESVLEVIEKEPTWYNTVMYYAVTRAKDIGLTKLIREPRIKVCPLCEKAFREDSLPHTFVKRLGIEHLDFCSPCLKEAVLMGTGINNMSKSSIISYLKELATITGSIPSQGLGHGINDFRYLNYEERLRLLTLLKRKPKVIRVKKVFGSWLNALIKAGILVNGARETSRGTHTLALDGHICYSLGEKTIDDYLSRNDIPHEREPKYPEGNYRGDFLVGSVFIEYFGLAGDPLYDAKSNDKIRLCKVHNIKLIILYPRDLLSVKKIDRLLSQLED